MPIVYSDLRQGETVTYKNRKATNYIIVHGADTPKSMDIGVEEIRSWHKTRGWIDVGYHYVIRRDGTVETGRPLATVGAHCKADGRNHDSIGICLVGGHSDFNYTRAQLHALVDLINTLSFAYPGVQVAGHRDFEDKKTCPGFDVHAWWYGYDNHSS